MAKATILFADNDEDFLHTRTEFLLESGYQVIPASTPNEVIKKLELGNIDLAVIDIRLTNDDDERDKSGLQVAVEIAQAVPKIILTGFPSYNDVRTAMKPKNEDKTSILDFVAKVEGPLALLRAIERALTATPASHPKHRLENLELEFEKRLTPITIDVTSELKMDYDEIRQEARTLSRIRLTLAAFGVVVIILGSLYALIWDKDVFVVSTSAGIIAELIVVLFEKWAREISRKRDHYHEELLNLLERDNRASRTMRRNVE